MHSTMTYISHAVWFFSPNSSYSPQTAIKMPLVTPLTLGGKFGNSYHTMQCTVCQYCTIQDLCGCSQITWQQYLIELTVLDTMRRSTWIILQWYVSELAVLDPIELEVGVVAAVAGFKQVTGNGSAGDAAILLLPPAQYSSSCYMKYFYWIFLIPMFGCHNNTCSMVFFLHLGWKV